MQRKFKGQKLWAKLTLMVFMTILVTFSLLYFLLNKQIISSVRKQEQDMLFKIGRNITKNDIVIHALEKQQSNEALQKYANDINQDYQLDFVVILTTDHIRLTHPDKQKIYHHFQGGDENKAMKGKETTSIAKGTLGESLRSFVPVYDRDKKQIGVIALGIKTQNVQIIAKETMKPFSISLIISLIFGFGTAIFFAFTLKKQMHDLEPKEIARLFEERNAMLDYTKDAIVVTNAENKIVLANLAAKDLDHLNNPKTDTIENKNLSDFLINYQLIHSKANNVETIDQLYHQNGLDYLLSIAPIINHKKVIGQIIIMRDATELKIVTDQLFNTANYAHELKIQSHDFLNKLHVIYGLTDLGEYDELANYLSKILEPEQEFSQRMIYLVHDPVIAGFLIGERSKFSEKNINFMIEIEPDIPQSENLLYPQVWINLIRFIDRSLLEIMNKTENNLQLRTGFWEGKLHTAYTIKTSEAETFFIKKQLNSQYFKQLLQYQSSQIKINFVHQVLTIQLTTIYIEQRSENSYV